MMITLSHSCQAETVFSGAGSAAMEQGHCGSWSPWAAFLQPLASVWWQNWLSGPCNLPGSPTTGDMRECGKWIVKGTYAKVQSPTSPTEVQPESCLSRCGARPSWRRDPCRTGLYETCCVCVELDLVLLGRIYTMPAQLSVEWSL